MHMTELPMRSPDLSRISFLAVIRKFAPKRHHAVPRDDACRELERLALSSPHLLPDLGFELDRAAAGPQRTVWRRPGFVVTIRPAVDPGTDPCADPCGPPRVEARRAPA